ncbi:hypothetical protein EPUS_03882 [Endocarpon pusillum Z07020]|uniref:N-acetyltransferase domain-containing protein n=1 Tax=Endocarpon pusillum (strain Z07020 / HMAS-L-300199) TaxID=1263415 RepID=U1HY77_ENDPU|nr:uncharacterized protein EPUS_03882 [Endocarpon pusillum Z07020]ERF74444.1 hypothetical protein EPUS_03882 [Endocarpon pusillum Z07020]
MAMSSQKRPGDELIRGVDAKKPRTEEGVQSPPDSASADHFIVEIKLRSLTKAGRNDPKSHKDRMETRWKELGLTSLDVKEKEDKVEELIVDVHTQSEGAEDRVEISSTTLSEPQAPENMNTGQIECGPADGESMDYDELLIEDEYPEDRIEDDSSFEEFTEKSSDDEFAEFEWLEPLDGTVTYTGGTADVSHHKQIGHCVGKLIRRSKIRSIFYHEMEEPSRETCLLAFDLFDRYGCLKPEYKNHSIRKGSGIWKEELDDGDILLIEKIKIDEEYRRRGLGNRVVTAMLQKTREKTRGFFAITWPTVLWTDKLGDEVDEKTETERLIILKSYDNIAQAFSRSLGFRRVGSSYWFALASDPGHPCHSLSVNDNYDPETPATDPSWFMSDKEGNTLLHIAALNSQPRTVDWIMKNEFGEQMLSTRNDAGDTPLEATLMDLEGKRTRREVMNLTVPMSDKFEGYSKSSVLCIARLKGLTKASQLDLARLTFGCTCGQCIEGFLSPRMTYALLCQAEIQHDLLNGEVFRELGPDWVDWHRDMFEYVPEKVQDNFKTNKSMRQGFTNMFDYIAACLRAKILPTETNVLATLRNTGEWPPATDNFLQRGGSVASVATMCFQLAMDQDEFAGDSQHQDVFSGQIEALPECRNDHEFGFVSGMCGYKRISQIRYVSVFGEPLSP